MSTNYVPIPDLLCWLIKYTNCRTGYACEIMFDRYPQEFLDKIGFMPTDFFDRYGAVLQKQYFGEDSMLVAYPIPTSIVGDKMIGVFKHAISNQL